MKSPYAAILLIAAVAGVTMAGRAQSGHKEDPELKKRLTPLQYSVTMQNGTERPFQNEYWNNHKDGIYVCM